MKIPLFVSTFNRIETVKQSLTSLANSNLPDYVQVIISDDGSSDPVVPQIKRLYGKLGWEIHANHHREFPEGKLAPIREHLDRFPDAPYFLVSDSDMLYTKNWVQALEKIYRDTKKDGVNPAVITGFDTEWNQHRIVERHGYWGFKGTVGGANLLADREFYNKWQWNGMHWDWGICSKAGEFDYKLVSSCPSLTEHIGKHGKFSKPGKYDVAVHFEGEDFDAMEIFNPEYKYLSETALVTAGQGVGNIVMATPLIEALHDLGYIVDFMVGCNWPKSKELFFENPHCRNVAWSNEHIDGFYNIVVETAWSFSSWEGKYATNRLARHDRHVKVDKSVVDHQYRNHEIHHNLTPAIQLGMDESKMNSYKPFVNTLMPHNYNTDSKVIGIHAGCNPRPEWEGKKYPYYQELVYLLKRDGYKIALFGTDTDQHLKDVDYDFIGATNVQGAAERIAGCDIFISNDSGLMHCAGASQIPQIAIFGGEGYKKMVKNDPRLYNDKAIVIGAEDLSTISPEQVMDTLKYGKFSKNKYQGSVDIPIKPKVKRKTTTKKK